MARIACSEPCELRDAKGSRQGTVWNLSVLGAYVVVDGTLPMVDALVDLSFGVAGDPLPIKVRARVAWQNPPSPFKGCGAVCPSEPPGCGLEFLDLSPEDRDRIDARVQDARRTTR